MMPHRFPALLVAVLLICAGCESHRTIVLNGLVGPAPHARPAPEKSGALLVYSAWETSATDDPDHPRRTDYSIFSTDGVLVQHVQNHTGVLEEGPVTVALPAGTYRIEARAARHGKVVLNVAVQAKETTVVHLDDYHPKSGGEADNVLIRLPDGQVVGWRASQ